MPSPKKNPGGSADRRRRGLVSLLVPVTPEEKIEIVAAAYNSSEGALTRWAQRALVDAARREKESSEKSSKQG
jgi:hypothetical protein